MKQLAMSGFAQKDGNHILCNERKKSADREMGRPDVWAGPIFVQNSQTSKTLCTTRGQESLTCGDDS